MEIVTSYVLIGMVIAAVYYTFRSVSVVIDVLTKLIYKSEPSRKRRFNNFQELFALTMAGNALGVEVRDRNISISKEDLRKKYIEAAKVTHPDCGGNAEEFIDVKQAYDILLPRAI